MTVAATLLFFYVKTQINTNTARSLLDACISRTGFLSLVPAEEGALDLLYLCGGGLCAVQCMPASVKPAAVAGRAILKIETLYYI